MLRRLFVLCSGGCSFQGLDGGQGRDGVLVDHLLLAIGYQYHHKAVKAGDDPTELEAIHQKQRHRHPGASFHQRLG